MTDNAENYEYLESIDGDDGFYDPLNPPTSPADPGPESARQTEQQTQQSQQQTQETGDGQANQTGQETGEQPTFDNLKPFYDEAGNLRAADLDGHLKAAGQMIGRQSNEIGELRARLRILEANRGTGAGPAGAGEGQQQQQSQQQQQQQQEFQVKLPEKFKGLLQQDDWEMFVHVIKEIVNSGASTAVRGELSTLAKESEQYQTQQQKEAFETRRDTLNSTLGSYLEYVGSSSETFKNIPTKVVYDAVKSDPEISEIISRYVDHADPEAFTPEIAYRLAVKVYSELAHKIESTASAHLQRQSGPQGFSPKVIPVHPIEQEKQNQRTPEEMELLGTFA